MSWRPLLTKGGVWGKKGGKAIMPIIRRKSDEGKKMRKVRGRGVRICPPPHPSIKKGKGKERIDFEKKARFYSGTKWEEKK